MSQARKRRGRETERIVAARFRDVFPYCEAVGAGSPGRDLTGTGALAVEIKAEASLRVPSYLRQADGHAGPLDIPLAIARQDSQGSATIDEFPTFIRIKHFQLLIEMLSHPTFVAIPVQWQGVNILNVMRELKQLQTDEFIYYGVTKLSNHAHIENPAILRLADFLWIANELKDEL